MDIKKLNKLSPKIKRKAIEEELEHIPASFFEFTNNEISNYSLNETKTGINTNVSARVITNWLQKDVIKIDDSDIGKVKRFNRLENIWLNVVIDLRKFGIPLNSLKYIRTQLFDYLVNDYCLFKLKILQSIIDSPEYLVINDNNEVGFYPYQSYADKVAKGRLYSHINLRFINYIQLEYPNNKFNIDFGIKNIDEDVEKVTLLFYLKTNDFKEIRIVLSDGDTRLITDSSDLKVNKKLLKIVQDWRFKSITVQINDEVKFIIEN
ncbi:hypothetical protein [Polaribacter sp. Hel1_85]|uniref:hypothetical protein n=1 Tax=Polaribacter sp. Hel1_85 TaxID=1250005 RepID=UPI00052CF880|nr:hypothetical protein [Polaribacter sp. Hel1_85]KGL61925.1 hypothetical protein PHEL85_1711 [Polaribacter sp. Hel1_85]